MAASGVAVGGCSLPQSVVRRELGPQGTETQGEKPLLPRYRETETISPGRQSEMDADGPSVAPLVGLPEAVGPGESGVGLWGDTEQSCVLGPGWELVFCQGCTRSLLFRTCLNTAQEKGVETFPTMAQPATLFHQRCEVKQARDRVRRLEERPSCRAPQALP